MPKWSRGANFCMRPIIHCCSSVIKAAMRTADKTNGFDFKRVPKSSEFHLLHLVYVTDKGNFRAVSTRLYYWWIHWGSGCRITSCSVIFVNSLGNGNATDMGLWNTQTSNSMPREARYASCIDLFKISNKNSTHKADYCAAKDWVLLHNLIQRLTSLDIHN